MAHESSDESEWELSDQASKPVAKEKSFFSKNGTKKKSHNNLQDHIELDLDDEEEEQTSRTICLDFRELKLKRDHTIRPIWVTPSRFILLEATSRFYRQAYDFLVAVAEPVARPRFVHEYRLTTYSLYAAISIGLNCESIISVLDRLSKVLLPEAIKTFIRSATANFGKAKIVLRQNRMFVESPEKGILERLLVEDGISAARRTTHESNVEFEQSAAAEESNLEDLTNIEIIEEVEDDANVDETDPAYLLEDSRNVEFRDYNAENQISSHPLAKLSSNGGHEEVNGGVIIGPPQPDPRVVFSFEIDTSQAENVRKAALQVDFPLMEEYDFRKDSSNANLSIELKVSTEIRPYQERSLSKMFGNGRARSGIIVLPCGAGKTLTGITACCTIKKSCIVLCTGAVAASQWKKQFQDFTTVSPKHIYTFTSKEKNEIDRSAPCILITTYSMMAAKIDKRSAHTAEVLQSISRRDWGLMILDEVHVTPARLFRKVLTNVKAHCKLGLTATLVREDQLIDDLNFLIGPKLYEANWLDLTNAGYLARVLCNEVRCPMTPEFFAEYLHESGMHSKQLLYTMNPNKCFAADFLVRKHEARGDKVLLFCDNIMAVKFFAEILNRPYISGETPFKERMTRYTQFRKSSVMSTLIVSKVGDIAIDLPEANVIVQVSSHFGSRRQEAQRLGRILRPKCEAGARTSSQQFDSYFYTLVSTNTDETFYATKRQQYLVNQGYTYKVVEICDEAKLALRENTISQHGSQVVSLLSRGAQLKLLQRILVLSQSFQPVVGHRVKPGKNIIISAKDEQKRQDVVEVLDNAIDEDSSNESEVEDEEEEDGEEVMRPVAKRRKTNLGILSGAGTLQYFEYDEDMGPK